MAGANGVEFEAVLTISAHEAKIAQLKMECDSQIKVIRGYEAEIATLKEQVRDSDGILKDVLTTLENERAFSARLNKELDKAVTQLSGCGCDGGAKK